MSERNDSPGGTQHGPEGAAQGKNWLGGPDKDPLREKAAEQARSVVEDGKNEDEDDNGEKSDADAAKERERQMEREGTETPG